MNLIKYLLGITQLEEKMDILRDTINLNIEQNILLFKKLEIEPRQVVDFTINKRSEVEEYLLEMALIENSTGMNEAETREIKENYLKLRSILNGIKNKQ